MNHKYSTFLIVAVLIFALGVFVSAYVSEEFNLPSGPTYPEGHIAQYHNATNFYVGDFTGGNGYETYMKITDGGDVFITGNMNADDYIEFSSIYDSDEYGNALDYIENYSYYLDDFKFVNHELEPVFIQKNDGRSITAEIAWHRQMIYELSEKLDGFSGWCPDGYDVLYNNGIAVECK